MRWIQPDAPNLRLYIDPVLPNWLPDLTLRDLTLDRITFDIRIWREGEATRWEVLKGDKSKVIQRDFASGSLLPEMVPGAGALGRPPPSPSLRLRPAKRAAR